MTGDHEGRSAREQLDAEDRRILEALAHIQRLGDPPPPGLADRVRFALSLRSLEAEVAELTTLPLTAAGTRGGGYELAQTVTFSGEHLTAMITIEALSEAERRLTGWVDSSNVRVELRTPAGTHATTTDEDGRFGFDHVLSGLVHLVLWRTDHAESPPLMSPPIQI